MIGWGEVLGAEGDDCDDLGIFVNGLLFVEVCHGAVGVVSGIGEEFVKLDGGKPANGLAGVVLSTGFVGRGEAVVVFAVEGLGWVVDAVPCAKCGCLSAGQGDFVICIPLVFRELALDLREGLEDGEVEESAGLEMAVEDGEIAGGVV